MLSSLQSGESGVSGNDAVSHHGGAGTLPSRIHLAFALYRCFLPIPTAGHWKAPFFWTAALGRAPGSADTASIIMMS